MYSTGNNDYDNNDSVRASDVLLGRGGLTNSHIGNREYRRIVFEHQAAYLNARKKQKVEIAKMVVAVVKQNGGRFLKKDANNLWVEVTDKRATEKTSQALREGLDVRNQTVRPNKVYRESKKKTWDVNQVVSGKVVCDFGENSVLPTYASSVVSVEHQDSHSLPDLHDELSHGAAAFLRYQPRDVNKRDLDDVCEV